MFVRKIQCLLHLQLGSEVGLQYIFFVKHPKKLGLQQIIRVGQVTATPTFFFRHNERDDTKRYGQIVRVDTKPSWWGRIDHGAIPVAVPGFVEWVGQF